jgi:acyl-CoA thioesterase-1
MICALFLVAANVVSASQPTILVIGDSLSAAYGIERQRGWVALLEERLTAAGLPYDVANASITGDTTRGGLARLPDALDRFDPAVVVIALGGNDGLRGFSPAQTRANLAQMIRLSREAGARVLLLGVRLPGNYGRAFGEKFHRVFLELGEQDSVALVPFFLEGVAETREFMQPDGIHPAAEAQPRILDNVWVALRPLLTEGQPSGSTARPSTEVGHDRS